MTALSQSDLLDVLRRVMDDAYIEPLEAEDDGAGFDVYQSIATMLARVSQAVETSWQSMYLLPHSDQTAPPAAGGVRASGNLLVSRATPTNGDVVLAVGDILRVTLRSLDGEDVAEADLEVTTETTFASGVSGPLNVPVRATRVGYHGNLAASYGRSVAFMARTTRTIGSCSTSGGSRLSINPGSTGDIEIGSFLEGAFVIFDAGPNVGLGPRRITEYDAAADQLVLSPAGVTNWNSNDVRIVDLVTLGFTAEIDVALSGGVAAMLDRIGEEHNQGRGGGETDLAYRWRILNLPDTVSPDAVYRAASRILTPLGIPFRLVEARNPNDIQGAAWDLFAWDDPVQYNWLLGRDHFFWQGDGFEYRGFYLIVVRQWYGDFGACFDQHPGGVHPSAAWDFMFFDGYPLGFYKDLARGVAEVERAREHGVPWLLVLVESIP